MCIWNYTVLALATLALCLKRRTCSWHNPEAIGRKVDAAWCGGTIKRIKSIAMLSCFFALANHSPKLIQRQKTSGTPVNSPG